MIPYILHTSILLAGSFIFYWALLRNETFYKINRYFLLATIGLSLVIPAIHVPNSYSIHEPEVIVFCPSPAEAGSDAPVSFVVHDATSGTDEVISLSSTAPIEEVAASVSWYTKMSSWNWTKWVWNIYLIGVAVFVINFLTQLTILLMKKRNLQRIEDGEFTIFELEDDSAPFSFLEWIFINPAMYDLDTFNQILDHEKIHIKQVHYVDKFLVELMVIVFWFNPFVWLYRKTVSNNLEFLTDAAMLDNGVAKETYQMSLLKVSVPEHALDLTTNYNESFLSERIRMMNAKRSSAKSSWKYLMILPVLTLSMTALNAVIPIVQEVQTEIQEEPTKETKIADIPKTPKQPKVAIAKKVNRNETKNASRNENRSENKAENKSESKAWGNEAWEKSHKVELKKKQEKVVFDKNAEMEVLLALADLEKAPKVSKSKKKHKSDKTNESTNWVPEHLKNNVTVTSNHTSHIQSKNLEYDDLKPGSYKGKAKGDEACFQLNNSDRGNNWNWNVHECFSVKEISNFSIGKDVAFHVKRDAGTMNFDGDLLTERYGYGVFDFEENKDFKSYLRGQGVSGLDDKEMLHLFLNKTDKTWVKAYKNYGFEMSSEAIVNLGVHGVDVSRLKEYNRIFDKVGDRSPNYKDMIAMAIHGVGESLVNALYEIDNNISVKDAINAQIHGVTPSFIKTVKTAGFARVSVKQVVAMKIHGVSTSDITNYKKSGYKADSPDELVNFAIHGVNPNTVNDFQRVGYNDLTSKELTTFAIHGVTPEYVRNVQEAGLESVTPQQMVNFAIHGVSSKWIKGFVVLGYRDITAEQLVNSAIHGVNTHETKRIHDLGYNTLSMEDLVNFNIHGVDSKYIQGLIDAGMDDLSASELVNGKIHGVSGHYIQDLQDLNIKGITFKKIINAKNHGVSATFIKKARSKGYNPKYLADYIDLKIHGL